MKTAKKIVSDILQEVLSASDKSADSLNSLVQSDESSTEPLLDPEVDFEEGLFRIELDRDFFIAARSVAEISLGLLEKLANQTQVSHEDMEQSLEHLLLSYDTPYWLQKRILTHLPPLILGGASDEDRGISDLEAKPFKVYLRDQAPKNCTPRQVSSYRTQAEEGDFDIYVEDALLKQIVVRGDQGRFRVRRSEHSRISRTKTLLVLSILLKHVGKEIRYSELATDLATSSIKPPKKGESTWIYHSLLHIRKQLRKAKRVNENEPDKWLTTTGNASVQVWEGLNSCLVLSRLPR